MKGWPKKDKVLVWILFVFVVVIISAFIPLAWRLVYPLVVMLFGVLLDSALEDKDNEPQPKRKLTDLFKSRDS